MKTRRRAGTAAGLALGAASALAALAAVAHEPSLGGQAAFEELKRLDGDWEGTASTPDGPAAHLKFEVTASGTVVRETQFPGTDHEMMSLYHLDRGELVVTHYCAMGNQPKMKLAKGSTRKELAFDFAGGSNLDPERDPHIHGGRIRLLDGDRLETEWAVFQGGKQVGSNKFFVARRRTK